MPENTGVQLFLALGIIVLAAKAAGYLSRRLGQPAVLGELLVGIVLGPSLLNLVAWSPFTDQHLSDTIQQWADLGVLLLMFSAGLEVHLGDLRRVGRPAISGGLIGVLFSVVLMGGVAMLANLPLNAALFIGTALAATSVSISAQTMLELGVLRTREGIALLGAAITDDMLSLLLLSIILGVSTAEDGVLATAGVVIRLVVFVLVALAIGWFFLPRLVNRVASLPISQGSLAVAIASALVFGWAAEALGGMAAITGAFMAGVCLRRADADVRAHIEEGLHSLNYGLFIPIFFVSIGLRMNLHELTWSILPFAVALLIAAALAKIIGCGMGARLGGFDNRSALRMGVGMISRGEVSLIIGALGLKYNVFPGVIFPVIVMVIVGTALLTPPLVRWAFSHSQPAPVLQTKQVEE